VNEIEDLFPFYALGTLTEEERLRVEEYVARDASAKARLDEMMSTAELLPLGTDPARPSRDVKQALMGRVKADADRRAGRRTPAAPGFLQMIRSLMTSPAFSLAALAAIVLLGLWIAGVQSRAADLAAENELLQSTVASLMAENELLRDEIGSQREVLALITSPERFEIPVAGTESEPDAQGTLFVGDSGDLQAVFLVSDLPSLPAGLVYQFWLIRGDTPVGAGLFSANSQGQGLLVVLAGTEPVLSFDAVGVSIEPDGGSPAPTGDIVLLGALPQG
jgi:anti-sigma-K factor RskA